MKDLKEIKRLNSMKFFIEETAKAGIKPKVIFDIGAYNGVHLQELGKTFNIESYNLFAFEPHPGMIPHCQRRINNVLECAISDYNGVAEFNAIDLTQNCNHGCSSLYPIKRPHIPIVVKVRRIDTLIRSINDITLPIPDMVKIDVEGKSFEVLKGFGMFLKYVEILHVETEIKPIFEGQKIIDDIMGLMTIKGFTAVHELFIPKFQKDLIFLRNDLVPKNFCGIIRE